MPKAQVWPIRGYEQTDLPILSRVNERLSSIERVRKVVIADEPFTVDNEQMTPTMKVRRHILKQIYGKRLESLYS